MSIRISRGIVGQVGLLGEAPRAQGPRVVMGDPQADRPADRAGVDLGPHRAIPGSEPPVLVDHQPDARRDAGIDHVTEIGSDQRRRLLAEDVDTVPRRQLDQLAMRIGLGADLDEIQRLFRLEELGRVGVDSGSGNPRRGLLQPLADPGRTARPAAPPAPATMPPGETETRTRSRSGPRVTAARRFHDRCLDR